MEKNYYQIVMKKYNLIKMKEINNKQKPPCDLVKVAQFVYGKNFFNRPALFMQNITLQREMRGYVGITAAITNNSLDSSWN